jgi:hypothetical protein
MVTFAALDDCGTENQRYRYDNHHLATNRKKYQKIAIFRQIYVFLGFITVPYPICLVLLIDRVPGHGSIRAQIALR